MSATIDIGSLIARTPDVCGGRPRIVGWDRQGLTPAEIVTQIPHLSLGQVHAALAYYFANRDELDAEIAAEEAEVDRLEFAARRGRDRRDRMTS